MFNEEFVRGMAVLGAGKGFAAGKGAEAVGRNPDAASKIQSIMVLGIALAETTGIYALVIAIILIFVKG